MSTYACTCNGFTLLNFGCKCGNSRTMRTIPLNILIPLVGWRKSWSVVDRHLWKIANFHCDPPTSDDGVMLIMGLIELKSISLYEEIARDIEWEYRYMHRPPSPPTDWGC